MRRDEHLPAKVGRLIEELASVGTLELLLLLRDVAPRRRSPSDICSALHCPASWAELQLARLREARLVDGDGDGGFAYAPRSPERAAAVDELARLWEQDRRAVTARMLAAPQA